MNKIELLNDQKSLDNSQDMLRDLLNGDESVFKQFEDMNLDVGAIKTALGFIMNNSTISDKEKTSLLENTWMINFRSKPPTPEEFLTEKYLGPVALHTYPRVSKVFYEFLKPGQTYRNLILYPHIGWGKAESYEETVYTPNGPKKIKDIKVGDEVCNTYSGTSKVIATQDFPDEKVYKITFSDKRTVLACGNHNWKASHSNNAKFWNKEKKIYEHKTHVPCWKTVTTEQILDDLKENPNHRWKIPMTKPVEHTKHEHLITPYTLGAYLGDGSYSNTPSIVNNDKQIFDRLAEESSCLGFELGKPSSTLYRGFWKKGNLNHSFKNELDRLGLKGKKSFNKFIPKDYLYDSIESRIALLQGLMDTDGTTCYGKNIPYTSYWTSSEQLAEDFLELVRGLGAKACMYKKNSHSKRKSNSSAEVFFRDKEFDSYIINFSFSEKYFNVFHLERKQKPLDDYYEREHNYKEKRKPQYLYIESIKLQEDKKGGICIEVDSEDSLFLTNSYIVTHNSYISTMITLYITLHVSLMRSPWKYFGLNPATILTQFLVSYNIKKAAELLLEPYNAMLESSPFFEKVKTREKMRQAEEDFKHQDSIEKIFYTTASDTSELVFTGGMNIKLTSNPTGLLGNTIVSSVLSELAFFRDAGKSDEFIMRIYNDAKQRVRNRMKGNPYGITILDSSPNTLDSPIDDYIVNEANKDPLNYVVRGAMWETTPEDFDFSKTFKVYTGGRGNPPKILEEGDPLLESDTADKLKIIEVPNRMKNELPNTLYTAFKDDLVKMIKDYGGIPSGSADALLYDYSKLEAIFKPGLRNIYYGIEAPASMNPIHLIWNQVKDVFFKNKAGKYEFYYKPHIPRVIAVDQSYATDVTGIAMCHVERFKDSGEFIYVVDFTIPLIPSKDDKINLEAIRCFIEDIATIGGIRLEAVGFDSFESQIQIQNLERKKYNCVKVSTDKTMEPYLNMINLINTGRIASGRNIFLKNNIKSLHTRRLVNKKGEYSKLKIDHDNSRAGITSGDVTWETSQVGAYAKDVSDAVADAIELCRKEFQVAEETWWSDPEISEKTSAREKEEARNKLNSFLSKMGMK